MSSSFGNSLKISIFGQSHSEAIGVVIDGLPAGEAVDLEEAARFLRRRAPGQNDLSTPRREADEAKVLSGLVNGITCGAPLAAVIENTNVRSKDYTELKVHPRPSHADYTAEVRYRGFQDVRGGGHFSGRLTAPLCFAGAVCLQILARRGVRISAHILSIGPVSDRPFDPVLTEPELLFQLSEKPFPVIDDAAGERMREEILSAKGELDSAGGVIECCALGLPAGIGDPIFDGVENRIAAAVFGIPAVRGIEFGAGFAAAGMRGSEHNDPYYYDGETVRTRTNHHGGALGGITSGMPVLFRTAIKPTPSIAREQQTVDLITHTETALSVHGRHDPCIVPRAVPCVEAAAAAALLDLMLSSH